MFDLPDLWSEVELRPYLGEVKRRHGIVETLALPSMRDLPPVQIETLFVPPLLASVPVTADSDPEVWPVGNNLLFELQDSRQLIVLGDPGGGKTTLSNWLAWRLAAGLNSPLPDALNNRVPIPCVLRDMPADLFNVDVKLADLACSVADKLLSGGAKPAVKEALVKRVNQGAYVLILDGIDEIPLDNRVVVSNWIREAYEFGGLVLATSRIVGYEDGPVDRLETSISHYVPKTYSAKKYGDFESVVDEAMLKEYKNSFAYAARRSEVKGPLRWAHIRYLMPFDQERISVFAENWYRQRCATQQEANQKTTDLLIALSKSEVTQKLARTPNLLSLMAIVHRERAHLPDGKALLYEEIVNAYINTIDKQRKIAPGDILAQYGWKDRKAWLAYVGFKMQAMRSSSAGDSRDAGILVDEHDVKQWLKDAMEISGVANPEVAASTFLNWVARRSGLLLPRGEARYAFVHLSFQEYFCACYLDSCIVRPAFVMGNLPKNALVTKESLAWWSEESHWLETLVFLFELLSAERDSEWVDNLAGIIFGDEIDSVPLFDQPSELAARLLKNKHIKISSTIRNELAVSLGAVAVSDWEGKRFNSDSGVLSSLLDTGYAVAIDDVLSGKVDDASKVISSKLVYELGEVSDPTLVRVLIIETTNRIDVAILKRFTNLKYLRIKGADIKDSSFLKGFTGLRLLQLSSLPLTEIKPLALFRNLYHVELHDMAISDVEVLSKLVMMQTLELHDIAATNLSSLQNLRNLLYLSVKNVNVTDLGFLARLKQLTTLQLQGLSELNVSSITSLKNLEYLKLAECPVKDLSFLIGLKRLRTLDLRGLVVDDIKVVGKMNGLAYIYIIACKFESLSCLSGLSKLKGLGVLDLPITDLDFVSGLKELQTLYLSQVNVEDLTPLASLKNLTNLQLFDLPVSNVSPLSRCKNLEILTLSCKEVVDVSPLKKLPKLHKLCLAGSGVEDLSPLESVEGLKVEWEMPY